VLDPGNETRKLPGQTPTTPHTAIIDVPYEVLVFYFRTKVRVFYSIFEDLGAKVRKSMKESLLVVYMHHWTDMHAFNCYMHFQIINEEEKTMVSHAFTILIVL
jgi:hypothetical protein